MADEKVSALPLAGYTASNYVLIVDTTTNPYTSKKMLLSSIPSGGGGTVYGNFTLSWSISGGAWFNYPTTSNFTTTLANVETAVGTPTYGLTGYGSSISGNALVPGSNQGLIIPARTAALPVTLSLTINATMNNSDSTTSPVSKTATAVYYLPIFYAVTNSSANPGFSTSSLTTSAQFAYGQTVTQTITSQSQYFWIGIPTPNTASNFIITGQFPVSITVDQQYLNQTITGTTQTYNVYGFTSLASQSQTIQVVS